MENKFKNYGDEQLFEEIFRATGKTTRIVDKLIQEFFEKPMGTKIAIVGHYPERRADEFLLNVFMKRLESEHPSATCKIHRGELITIERTTKTYHEEVEEEYKRRQSGN